MSNPNGRPPRRSWAERLAKDEVRLRAAYPQLYWDPDVLVIEQVAQIMRCSVDTVRRVVRNDLPYHRPGKQNLYFREDVLRYIRMRRVTVNTVNVDALLAEIEDASNVTVLPHGQSVIRRRKA
jgi:excisionase family DNA binding protein